MRQYGVSADAAKLPWMEGNAGLAIANEPDVAELWDRIKEIRRRRRSWLKVIGQDDHAKISSIKPVSDYTLDMDPTPSADTRTEAEKEIAAERAWNMVANALFAVDPLLLRYVEMAIVRDEKVNGPPIAKILRLPALKEALGC